MDNNSKTGKTSGTVNRLILSITETIGKIPAFAKKRRLIILLIITAITVIMASGIGKLRMEHSLESFFNENDAAFLDYRVFKNTFGSDEGLVIMYEPKNKDIFSKESLASVKKLEDAINAKRNESGSPLDRIKRVRSIVSADYLETNGDSLINRKFIGDNIPQTKKESEVIKKQALEHKDYPGNFFSKDLKYGLIVITTDFGTRLAKTEKTENEKIVSEKQKKGTTKPSTSSEDDEFDFEEIEDAQTDRKTKTVTQEQERIEYEALQPIDYMPFMKELRQTLKDSQWSPMLKQRGISDIEAVDHNTKYAIAGSPWFLDFIGYLMQHDMAIIMMLAVFVTFALLAISFRSFSALLWPFVIIVLSEICTIGLIAHLGIPATMMLNIVIFLILVLGVASSVHLISGFRMFLSEGYDSEKALSTAYLKSGFAIILASLTTMGGLLALSFVPIVPIANFSYMAAFGIFFALVFTLFLLPVLLSFWHPHEKKIKNSNKNHHRIENFFQKILANIAEKTIKHPKKILIIFILGAMFFSIGFRYIKIDTSFNKAVLPGNGISEIFDLIDSSFGGASSVEVIFDTGKIDGVKKADLLLAIDKFAKRVLKDEAEFVPRGFSLVNAAKESHRILTDGWENNYRLPETDVILRQTLVMYDSADPENRRLMVDDDWKSARLSLMVYTKSSYEYKQFMRNLNDYKIEYFNSIEKENPNFKVYMTGGIPLMMRSMSFLAHSQIQSFAMALFVVCIILLLIYGSIKFGILAIIPNLVPMTAIVGVAGWFGIMLDVDTLIVMPLAMGIVVDDTIHFLTHYRAELARGSNAQDAIRISLKEVGQAVTFTSFIIIGGFMVLAGSVYIPNINFAVLSAVAIFTALLADLFLLPALLLTFYNENSANRKNSDSNILNKKIQSAMIILAVLAGIFFIQEPILAEPVLKQENKAKEIVRKMLDRDDGKSGYSETLLVSCAYKELGGKRKCSSSPRKKVFEGINKDVGKNGKDSISVSILIEPSSEKGVAFLQKDYDDENKDGEQWIYLPAMKKLKRIVSSGANEAKTGTVFGSELSYEDMEKTHLSDYKYSLISEDIVDGKKVWVIESYPIKKRKAKTSYGKSRMYVDKEKNMALKIELFNKQNNLKKTIFFRKIENFSGIDVARQIIVVNHINSRMSMMKITKMALNINIRDEVFTPRALKETGYREALIAPVRNKAK